MEPIQGKRVLITGANSGVGLETARGLAAQGALVLAACRSRSRGEAAIDELRASTGNSDISYVPLDLGSLENVRACGERLRNEDKPLDILINNAGLAGTRGTTEDGFELTYGVNHLGHFLLTALLFPLLKQAPHGRVIHVASKAHYAAKGIDWEALRRPTKTLVGMREYQVSKLANILFGAELARRASNSNVVSVSLHPGVVASNIWRRIPWPLQGWMKRSMISNTQGAETSLFCATAETLENGAYYDRCKPKTPSSLAQDPALAQELWKRSETQAGQVFDPQAD